MNHWVYYLAAFSLWGLAAFFVLNFFANCREDDVD